MNRENMDNLCREKETQLMQQYFGRLVEEAAQLRPETIGHYTPELPQQIAEEYRAFLENLWEQNAPPGSRPFKALMDKQELSQKMTDDDREAILHAHAQAQRRTLWERLTRTNHKDVTYYKALLQEYTRDLLLCMRCDFMEDVPRE